MPEPGPGEAVVRVRGVEPQLPRPRQPDRPDQGAVAAGADDGRRGRRSSPIGDGVTSVAVGDRVIGAFHPAWLDGRPRPRDQAADARRHVRRVAGAVPRVPAPTPLIRVPAHLTRRRGGDAALRRHRRPGARSRKAGSGPATSSSPRAPAACRCSPCKSCASAASDDHARGLLRLRRHAVQRPRAARRAPAQLRSVGEAVGRGRRPTTSSGRATAQGMGVAYRSIADAAVRTSHRELFGRAFVAMASALGGASRPTTRRMQLVDRQYRGHDRRRRAARRLPRRRSTALRAARPPRADRLEHRRRAARRTGRPASGSRARLDAWTSSEAAGSCKPDPGIYRFALAKARVRAGRGAVRGRHAGARHRRARTPSGMRDRAARRRRPARSDAATSRRLRRSSALGRGASSIVERELVAMSEPTDAARASSSTSGSATRRRSRSSRWSAAGRARSSRSTAAASGGCCAGAPATRARRPRTTCCASSASSTRSRTSRCRSPGRCSPATTPTVFGAPFYVMERIDGVPVRSGDPRGVGRRRRRRTAAALERARRRARRHPRGRLAGVRARRPRPHRAVPRAPDRPLAVTARVLRRPRPAARRTASGDWLEAHRPPDQPPALCHGDYKLDNVLFAPRRRRRDLLAVVDWEMASIGDPLVDLAWALIFHPGPGGHDAARRRRRHRRSTGRRTCPSRGRARRALRRALGPRRRRIGWYDVFSRWKLAIVLEGSYAKFLRGLSDKPIHEFFGSQADLLLDERDDRSIDGETPDAGVAGAGRRRAGRRAARGRARPARTRPGPGPHPGDRAPASACPTCSCAGHVPAHPPRVPFTPARRSTGVVTAVGEVRTIVADVTDEEQVKAAVDQRVDRRVRSTIALANAGHRRCPARSRTSPIGSGWPGSASNLLGVARHDQARGHAIEATGGLGHRRVARSPRCVTPRSAGSLGADVALDHRTRGPLGLGRFGIRRQRRAPGSTWSTETVADDDARRGRWRSRRRHACSPSASPAGSGRARPPELVITNTSLVGVFAGGYVARRARRHPRRLSAVADGSAAQRGHRRGRVGRPARGAPAHGRPRRDRQAGADGRKPSRLRARRRRDRHRRRRHLRGVRARRGEHAQRVRTARRVAGAALQPGRQQGRAGRRDRRPPARRPRPAARRRRDVGGLRAALGATAPRPAAPGARQPAHPVARAATRTSRRPGRWSRCCAATGSRRTPRCRPAACSPGRPSGSARSRAAAEPPPARAGAGPAPGGDPAGVDAAEADDAVRPPHPLRDRGHRSGRRRPMTIPTLDATGKVVVVTGGSKGLGRAMALGFAEAGADVVVASRKLEALRGGGRGGAGARPAGARGRLPRRRLGRSASTLVDATVARVRPHRRARQQRRHRAGAAVAGRRSPRTCSTRRSPSTSRARCGSPRSPPSTCRPAGRSSTSARRRRCTRARSPSSTPRRRPG